MNQSALGALATRFQGLPDPRVERTRQHFLIEIVLIAICAVLCGAEAWTEVEAFGKIKRRWLRRFLKLPNGIPSHDTFGRVFAAIDAEEFQRCFLVLVYRVKPKTTQFNVHVGQCIACECRLQGRHPEQTSNPTGQRAITRERDHE